MKYITKFQIMKILYIILIFNINAAIQGQSTISGVIRDVSSRTPIQMVNIIFINNGSGSITDHLGRYFMTVDSFSAGDSIQFKHIAYETSILAIDDLIISGNVFLVPRVIPLESIDVGGISGLPDIKKDIPQVLSVIEAYQFELRGFIDAGDILKTDNSIQIEGDLNGKETISMRGGNADETLILYNGIKMNSAHDNIFDLSLIDLEDVERFEIIKGNHSTMYGLGAFSGIINIVPKVHRDYTFRFHQRIGTYNSGDWGLNLYKKLGNLSGTLTYKEGGYYKYFSPDSSNQINTNALNQNPGLVNRSIHRTGTIRYQMPGSVIFGNNAQLQFMHFNSTSNFENQRDLEFDFSKNILSSLQFKGSIFTFNDFTFLWAQHKLNEKLTLLIPLDLPASELYSLNRQNNDVSTQWRAEKTLNSPLVDQLFIVHMEKSELVYNKDVFDDNSIITNFKNTTFFKDKIGFASITKIKYNNPIDNRSASELHISVGLDRIADTYKNKNSNSVQQFNKLIPEKTWEAAKFTISSNLSGKTENKIKYDMYYNYGFNTKFPTLFQQLSSPLNFIGESDNILEPEKARSFELSMILAGTPDNIPDISNYSFSVNYFNNTYQNKFRMIFPVGTHTALYDNVLEARMSGVESKISASLFNKLVDVDFGLAKYYLSDKAAFPFKSDLKITSNFNLKIWDWGIQLHSFIENEQIGWTRTRAGEFNEIILPKHKNMDFHIKKIFKISFNKLRERNSPKKQIEKYKEPSTKIILNISMRNLLDDDFTLEGLPLRDRRYYVSMGVQF